MHTYVLIQIKKCLKASFEENSLLTSLKWLKTSYLLAFALIFISVWHESQSKANFNLQSLRENKTDYHAENIIFAN